jgi:hypothetical protein
MNSCEFKEIIVVDGFKVENGVLGLEQDIYLSVVKFVDLLGKKIIINFSPNKKPKNQKNTLILIP